MFELQQAMHRLDEEEESLEACSKDDQDPLTGLSQSIREYCTPKELETLDMVTNLAQMARLYREYESWRQSGSCPSSRWSQRGPPR